MKIKTISSDLKWVGDFDNKVNEAMDAGWQLVRREVIPGGPLDSNKLYAELVLPDTPAPFDPALALHQVQTFCHSVDQNDCGTDRCPLNGWCQRLRDCADPTDWDLSEEVPF
jgi:hypothetical protein